MDTFKKIFIIVLGMILLVPFVFSDSDWTKGNIHCTSIVGGTDSDFCTDGGGSGSGQWDISTSQYLVNLSNILDVDETELNATIDARASNITLETIEENVTVSVSSGAGVNFTSTCCSNNEILQIAVFPTTSTNTYRFQAQTNGSAEMVDKDFREHTGDWIIAHRGSTVSGDVINYTITGASIDEDFTIRVRYLG